MRTSRYAAIVTVSATDADNDDSIIEAYDIVTGADGSQFSIVSDWGCVDVQGRYPKLRGSQGCSDVTDPDNASNNNVANNNEYIVYCRQRQVVQDARVLTVRDTLKVTVMDVTETAR